jgi:hypothetical protein
MLKNIIWLTLDNESKQKLLETVQPKFSKIYCDHITLDWDTNLEDWKQFEGKTYNLETNRIANDKFIQAIPVNLESIEVMSVNKVLYIIVSGEPQTHPFYSNAMLHLAESYTEFSTIKINATVQILNYESN